MLLLLCDPTQSGSRAVLDHAVCNDDELTVRVVELIKNNFEDPGAPLALAEAKKFDERPYIQGKPNPNFLKDARNWIDRINAKLKIDDGSQLASQIDLRI